MSESSEPTRDIREPIPPLSQLLGYGPAAIVLLLGLGGWLLPQTLGDPAAAAVTGHLPVYPQAFAVTTGWLFATAILLFLAGVTRGLSFFSPRGPHWSQLVMMLWLFLLGFGALITPLWVGFALLILGYGSIAAFDPQAARAGLAPGYFARLRPSQMVIFIGGLALLLVRTLYA